MKILDCIYCWALFLFVSWTVYNTFIFVCVAIPSENMFARNAVCDFWNFYLPGALNFRKSTSGLYDLFIILPDTQIRAKYWPLFLYIIFLNGLSAYIWCNDQNPFTACVLATTPCIAGQFFTLIFIDGELLLYGLSGTLSFYLIMNILKNYRKKHYSGLTFPAWLAWRNLIWFPCQNG